MRVSPAESSPTSGGRGSRGRATVGRYLESREAAGIKVLLGYEGKWGVL